MGQVLLNERLNKVRLDSHRMGTEHVGHKLVADCDRVLALRPDLAHRGEIRGRARLHSLGNDGKPHLVSEVVHHLVPIVGQQTDRHTRLASAAEPHASIARNHLRVAGDEGVIDVEQHVFKPASKDVLLDRDLGKTGEISIGFEICHGLPLRELPQQRL